MGYKYFDANGNEAPEGSAESAFQFKDGSPQLEAFHKSLKSRKSLARPAPQAAEENDNSTERVSKPSK